jgi:hypothetical protein
VIWAEERFTPIPGPKSITSLNAGLRASGNGSALRILPPRQFGAGIILRDLGRGALHPDPGAEIDHQLERWLARLRERLGAEDFADADINAQEIVKADGSANLRGGVVMQVHRAFLLFVDRSRTRSKPAFFGKPKPGADPGAGERAIDQPYSAKGSQYRACNHRDRRQGGHQQNRQHQPRSEVLQAQQNNRFAAGPVKQTPYRRAGQKPRRRKRQRNRAQSPNQLQRIG